MTEKIKNRSCEDCKRLLDADEWRKSCKQCNMKLCSRCIRKHKDIGVTCGTR